MTKEYINDGWYFTPDFSEKLIDIRPDDLEGVGLATYGLEKVRIPHTVKEVPYHYFDESEYQMIAGYVYVYTPDESLAGSVIKLNFEGVGHEACVYVNGKICGRHACGYTAFNVDISSMLVYGKPNIITVRVDSRETLNQPPFGFVIDYMTFGGIYRDVYISVTDRAYIEDSFVYSEIREEQLNEYNKGGSVGRCEVDVCHEITFSREAAGMKAVVTIRDEGDVEEKTRKIIYEDMVPEGEDFSVLTHREILNVKLWDIRRANRYEIETFLYDGERLIDRRAVMTGFRQAKFTEKGFLLNGRRLKIRGLNRHQSYPYVGYAMPESMQRYDAKLLKKELGVNAVRTSHYPQSHYFIDECDRLGLLVFTEIPGWQHIGDDNWKDKAVQNTKDMVRQYRNHPSIIIWGVRINESVDDDDFYIRTNAAAHNMDPSRPTGGVRNFKKSHLFEDVYTYNEFVHSGDNKGCEPRSKVTSDMSKPYLITEYNGHMFPTKTYDWEEKRSEHALRHVKVLDDVAKEKDICGSFAWCMFDYNTHKDFGSGDRICYHGVMDMFRNPKLAAAPYSVYRRDVFLEISSSFDIGEHPGCNRGEIWIYTNADSVKMYKNDSFIKEYFPKDTPYKSMRHGPILIDDYVGDALESEEGLTPTQRKILKRDFNSVVRTGTAHISPAVMLDIARLVTVYGLKASEGIDLYTRHIGDWGGESTVYKFEAIKGGEVVKTVVRKPMTRKVIACDLSSKVLYERVSYDVCAVRIRMEDENGNLLSFANDPVKIEVTGAGELTGPDVISLNGGMGGFYVRSAGSKGNINVKISSEGCETREFDLTVV